jgi:hypothetical protein
MTPAKINRQTSLLLNGILLRIQLSRQRSMCNGMTIPRPAKIGFARRTWMVYTFAHANVETGMKSARSRQPSCDPSARPTREALEFRSTDLVRQSLC